MHVDYFAAVVFETQRRKARETSSYLAILFARSVVKEKYKKTEGFEQSRTPSPVAIIGYSQA